MRTHGGAREGAGRKAVALQDKRVTLGVRVTPDTKRWLDEQTIIQGVSIGKIIDELVKAFIDGTENEI